MRYNIPAKIDIIISSLKGYYKSQNDTKYLSLLNKAKAEINEAVTYDNWNGGQAGHDLYLTIPFDLYCKIVNCKGAFESKLCSDINKFHNYAGNQNSSNEWIESVFINSLPAEDDEPYVEPEAINRIWDDGFIKVFISHRDIHRKEVSQFSSTLEDLGFSCFVAHESIQPSQEWLDEIENALRSMDIFVVYHKDKFHESSYCDQEVGFALARGVPIFILWHDADYKIKGFLSKIQAVKAFDLGFSAVAGKLISKLRESDDLKKKHDSSLISALCSSSLYIKTARAIDLLNQYTRDFSDHDIERLVNAYNSNEQIYRYTGKQKKPFFDRIIGMHSVKKYAFDNSPILSKIQEVK